MVVVGSAAPWSVNIDMSTRRHGFPDSAKVVNYTEWAMIAFEGPSARHAAPSNSCENPGAVPRRVHATGVTLPAHAARTTCSRRGTDCTSLHCSALAGPG